ncbi:MAG: endonuclease/exonuclease/phosphatase family protein [Candidatus Omnitrophota bacterium]|nr:endonuclease/exonuclease/phosphatase family protein [Candidatus Omnitrophota bacterium]MDZ4242239.1 endonuclease/exonuclease/phosphatase family protein [Candidatus Omnitrophota bacterium]
MPLIPLSKTRRASCLGRLLVFFVLIVLAILYFNPWLRKIALDAVAERYPQTKTWPDKAAKAAGDARDLAVSGYNKGKKLLQSSLPSSSPAPKAAPPSRPAKLTGEKDEIRIGSFNIRIFSNNSRTDDELQQIADILKYYDVIAIQELRDGKVLQRTTDILAQMGQVYDYIVSPPTGRGVKERYAFVFRPDKIQLIGEGRLYDDPRDVFMRSPFYATFRAGNFDFTLITVHLVYGDFKDARRKEIHHLARVYREVMDTDPREKDIIVLGDFNLPPVDSGWADFKAIPEMIHLISPPEKTTITDTSLYDNFWFQRDSLREYTGRAGVIRFDENMFQNDDAGAERAVSDHRPIWADFRTSMQDDD